MTRTNRIFPFACRSLALSAFIGAGLSAVYAQSATPIATGTTPTLNLQLPVDSREVTFSSSVANNEIAVAENHFDFLSVASTQPPPRRGYGRPRYRGSNTNSDGSDKYTFLAGGGFTQPIGNTYHYLTPSWGLQVGGGRNFDKNFGLLAQFDYDNFGFNRRTITSQAYIYFNDPANTQYGLDGSSHVWSLTLNPTYTISSEEGLGAYIVGGVGFYHKTAEFTVPVAALGYDPYYGSYQYTANQTVDKYTSNAPGFNGGFGLTYKISRFSGQRLYAEVRYVYVANKQRSGITAATISQATAATTNFFPANSNRTTYIPVKVGLRF